MFAAVVRRALMSALMLILVSMVVFLLAHLSGDPVRLILGTEVTPEQMAAMRHELGLDRPLPVQYLNFLVGALQGDLGKSLYYKQPALKLVLERVPATVQLSSLSMLIALLVAVPTGILSALKPNSWLDFFSRLTAIIGQSLPSYWVGIMLIILFAVRLHWLPAGGRGSAMHLVLPAITLGFWPMARISRILRSSMIEALCQDYVRTARSKGLAERSVIVRHALKNALIPVVTVIGLTFGIILGGTVITESVFAWPGVGRLALEAITNRDFPLVQAIVLVASMTFVAINFLVDVACVWLDPRVRLN